MATGFVFVLIGATGTIAMYAFMLKAWIESGIFTSNRVWSALEHIFDYSIAGVTSDYTAITLTTSAKSLQLSCIVFILIMGTERQIKKLWVYIIGTWFISTPFFFSLFLYFVRSSYPVQADVTHPAKVLPTYIFFTNAVILWVVRIMTSSHLISALLLLFSGALPIYLVLTSPKPSPAEFLLSSIDTTTQIPINGAAVWTHHQGSSSDTNSSVRLVYTPEHQDTIFKIVATSSTLLTILTIILTVSNQSVSEISHTFSSPFALPALINFATTTILTVYYVVSDAMRLRQPFQGLGFGFLTLICSPVGFSLYLASRAVSQSFLLSKDPVHTELETSSVTLAMSGDSYRRKRSGAGPQTTSFSSRTQTGSASTNNTNNNNNHNNQKNNNNNHGNDTRRIVDSVE
eukprot:c816_g1_i1.p1 GENE.c816_g1_i1~~c816_g1_i1.p1  ORF type:complete len:402 (+),score=54.80 c816_g1_i1:72-1277(+)